MTTTMACLRSRVPMEVPACAICSVRLMLVCNQGPSSRHSLWQRAALVSSSMSAALHSAGRVSIAHWRRSSGHCNGQDAAAASTVADMPFSVRKSAAKHTCQSGFRGGRWCNARWCVPAHSSCIGNNTAAHASVHLVGIPPGGHSTPVVQQLSVTIWMNARNSGKDAQLAGAVGTAASAPQTRARAW